MCRARLNRRARLWNLGAEKGSAAMVAGGCLVGERFSSYFARYCRRDRGARSIRGREVAKATWFQGYMGVRPGSQLSVQRGIDVREGFTTAYLSARFRISLCPGVRKSLCCDNVSIVRRTKLGCAPGHMIERQARLSDPQGRSGGHGGRVGAMIRLGRSGMC